MRDTLDLLRESAIEAAVILGASLLGSAVAWVPAVIVIILAR